MTAVSAAAADHCTQPDPADHAQRRQGDDHGYRWRCTHHHLDNEPPHASVHRTVSVGRDVEVSEFEYDSTTGTYDIPYGLPFAPTIASNGSFTFPFPTEELATGNSRSMPSRPSTEYPSVGTTTSDVYVQIDDTTPAAVTDSASTPPTIRDRGGQYHQRPHAVLHRYGPGGRYHRVDRKRELHRPKDGDRPVHDEL